MKIAYILALLATFGTAVMGWMNRQKFIELRQQKDADAIAILKTFEELNTVNDETTVVHEEYLAQTQQMDKATSALNGSQKNITSLNKNIKQNKEMLAAHEAEEADTRQKIKDLLGEFGDPKEITAKRDALLKEVQDLENKKRELEGKIEIEKGLIAENNKIIAKLKESQDQRSAVIALETKLGTIVAVNPDWGFAILNMGKTQGISPTTRLLVKRGDQLIGRLNIIQVESQLTVADIDMKSLRGGNIQPGDQVVFENAQ